MKFRGTGYGPEVVALLAVGAIAVLGVVTLTTLGARRTAELLVLLAAVTASMVDVRVTSWLQVADVALLAAFVLLVLSGAPVRLAGYGVPVLALALIAAGGLAGSVDQDNESLVNLGKFMLAAGTPLVVLATLRPGPLTIRRLTFGYVFGVLVSGVVGVVFGESLGGRLEGLSGHPNHLGLAAAIALPMSIALAINVPSGAARVGRIAMAGGVGLIIVLAGSRAAGLAAVTGVVAVVVKMGSVRAARLVIGAAVIGTVLTWSGVVDIGDQSLIARVTNGELTAESNASRAVRVEDAWERIDAAPILGSGFADARVAHSAPLQLWQGAGLLGLVSFAMLAAMAAVRWRRTPRAAILGVGMWAGYLGYVVSTPVGNQLWDRYIWIPLAIALAASRGLVDAPQISYQTPELWKTNS